LKKDRQNTHGTWRRPGKTPTELDEGQAEHSRNLKNAELPARGRVVTVVASPSVRRQTSATGS
jgi:hypothetical protein